MIVQSNIWSETNIFEDLEVGVQNIMTERTHESKPNESVF